MECSGSEAEREERGRSTGGKYAQGRRAADGGKVVDVRVDVDVDVNVGMRESVRR